MPETPMQAVLRALDALDLDAAVALFAPDGSLTTAFGQTVTGADQVRGQLRMFLGELRATRHEVSSEWNPEDGIWIAEMSATYELTDRTRRGPYSRVIIVRDTADGISQMRIYGSHELPLAEGTRPYTEVRGPRGWLPTL